LINYGEGFTRKRTLENLDQLIRNNIKPDEDNLATILEWHKLNPRLNLLDKNLYLHLNFKLAREGKSDLLI
tara:strand:- start:558 stop:770 length:213 start_codon:yes stop_codon:yes gene_type:complete